MDSTEAIYESCILGNYGKAPLTLVRGLGCQVWDDAGRAYLDFISGIAVNTLGHSHPRWVARVSAQAAELAHVSNLFRNLPQAQLAQKIVSLAGPGRAFFCNSGAEANEALLKLARLHGRRRANGEEGRIYKVLTAENSFHGRTFGGMAATPQEKIQGGFRPMLPGFAHGRFNDLESFRALVDDSTCAIFLETIQGEGGVIPATEEFLVGIRELCNQHNLLLLIDEVQCGIGRTGTFFAFQQYGIEVDAIGMAKGLGGGFPIGAIWVAEPHADLFQPGMHGTTFGGNPLACAAALETLAVIEEEDLLQHVRSISETLRHGLENLVGRFPQWLAGVRGRGLHIALLVRLPQNDFIAALRENGLLTVRAGSDAVRYLPPLNTPHETIEEALRITEQTLRALH